MSDSTLVRILLNGCKISISGKSLNITCPNENSHKNLLQERYYVSSYLIRIFDCKRIHLNTVIISYRLKDTRIHRADCGLNLPTVKSNQKDLIRECLSYEGACSIVGMLDHKGYFSNSRIVLASGVHPNVWSGKNMSDYWFPDELNNYLNRLNKDGQIRNYSYVAKMISGEKARLTVDARLVIWNGEPARLVKTIKREIIN